MTRLQLAEQFRAALQMFAAGLDEEKALEVATVFEPWTPGRVYEQGEYLTHGTNGVGDPQLYKVAQGHTSAAEWPPGGESTEALYTAIGLNSGGYPIWSPPTGVHDAYNTGDIVDHGGVLYVSQIDGNTTVPGTDERWWKIYAGVI